MASLAPSSAPRAVKKMDWLRACPPYAPGTYVREEDIRGEKVTFIEDHPDLRYSWTAGQAISRFLNGLKEGKIYGVKCNKCRRIMVPPRTFCELCYKPIDEWVELKDTGTVLTFFHLLRRPRCRTATRTCNTCADRGRRSVPRHGDTAHLRRGEARRRLHRYEG